MPIDTSSTIEIGYSPLKMLGLAMLFLTLSAAAGGVAFGLILDIAPNSARRFVGWLGFLFFGLATGVICWRGATQRSPILTLSPCGILDTRVAPEVIPWRAVHTVSTWSAYCQKSMVLGIDPALMARLSLTRHARWTRNANRLFGLDGVWVQLQGLKIRYRDLLAAAIAYREAAHQE